ncbi:hypothetical protein LJC06_01560 [Bacteroidales bacterium OttesenSCG-928-I14]|nr:hypothetical protein [Bacteroidales bacterium OttesenSCG-928-I14]
MRKLSLILLALSFLFVGVNAQEETFFGKQFYVELAGPGLGVSANFDSRFKNKEAYGFGYRLGLGFAQYKSFSTADIYNSKTKTVYTIPLGINYVFGKSKSSHTFEVGVGATILTKTISIAYDEDNNNVGEIGNFIGHFSFLYRRQPVNGGFTWRIGISPIIGTSGDLIPYGLVGFGYAF